MMYDVDYEIYKFIDEEADKYVEVDELLKQNHLTLGEAQLSAKNFKEQFYTLLEKYSIGCQNPAVTCYELMECIYQQPDNDELKQLYFSIITDFGFLSKANDHDFADEQNIRNYLHQRKLIMELSFFLKTQINGNNKLNEIREYLKSPKQIKNIACEESEEFEQLYSMTIQHTFLHECAGNEVYKDNLNALLANINGDEILKPLKPYILFAVLARKTGMMRKREHFFPNLKAIFQYQNYNVLKDNGKNFNKYQSELELYDHLQRFYMEDKDVNMEICNYCFANLSSLSEWYYNNCEPNEDI